MIPFMEAGAVPCGKEPDRTAAWLWCPCFCGVVSFCQRACGVLLSVSTRKNPSLVGDVYVLRWLPIGVEVTKTRPAASSDNVAALNFVSNSLVGVHGICSYRLRSTHLTFSSVELLVGEKSSGFNLFCDGAVVSISVTAASRTESLREWGRGGGEGRERRNASPMVESAWLYMLLACDRL